MKALCLFASCLVLGTVHGEASTASFPAVFPIPQEIELRGDPFRLDETAVVALPPVPSPNDILVAHLFVAELSDRFGVGLKSESLEAIAPGRRVIVMGSWQNPLVQKYAAQFHIEVGNGIPGPEGYVLVVEKDVVLIAGADEAGAFYGFQSLRQLLVGEGRDASILAARIKDWSYKPFRGVRLFLPGPDNVPFFKRFVRDFVALYKFNKLIVETNATMRLDRHPELNAGAVELSKDLDYSRRDRPTGPGDQYQDSTHHDAADGRILEKGQVAELVAYAKRYHVEVIPEIPSLTHSYYLLTRHRELAEIQVAEWPDTYCPADPRSRALLFDVMDEYLDVFQPKMVHIAHDEWRMPVGTDPRCRGKDAGELFIEDVQQIHRFLTQKGIAVAMWGDHLLESVHGKGLEKVVSPSGHAYERPGSLTPEQVMAGIPKDILIFNWFWEEKKDRPGEANDLQLQKWGFRQVYGNMTPLIRSQNYERRSALSGVMGGAPSSWSATTEFNLGKDRMLEYLGTSNLLWSRHWPADGDLAEIAQHLMPAVRRNLSGKTLPSDDANTVTTLDIAAAAAPISGIEAAALKGGRVSSGRKTFDLLDPGANGNKYALTAAVNSGAAVEAHPVPVGHDVSSLLFLHACAKAASNDKTHKAPYNFADTADLLGWYEIVYEDGLIETLPIRYGVNILESSWRHDHGPATYCYEADPVEVGSREDHPVTFFALEWVNPRFGKIVKEVRLHGSPRSQNLNGKPIAENAIFLAALSFVQKRGFPEPFAAEAAR